MDLRSTSHTGGAFIRIAAALLAATVWLPGCDAGSNSTPPGERLNSDSAKSIAPLNPASSGHARMTTIKANCIVQSQHSVKLKAELGGRIDSVNVALGQAVESGQLLARMRTQDQQLELERLDIALEQSSARADLLQAQIRQAEATWEATKALYLNSAPAVLPKEALLLQERRADLRLTQLTSEDLRLQRTKLERTITQAEIRSPMRGVVLVRNAEVGMVVAAGAIGVSGSDILFELGDPEQLRAECAASESDASRLKIELPMRLRIDGADKAEIELKVTRIAPAIQNDSGSSSLLFWGDFAKPQAHNILAGMHGSASVQVPHNSDK